MGLVMHSGDNVPHTVSTHDWLRLVLCYSPFGNFGWSIAFGHHCLDSACSVWLRYLRFLILLFFVVRWAYLKMLIQCIRWRQSDIESMSSTSLAQRAWTA